MRTSNSLDFFLTCGLVALAVSGCAQGVDRAVGGDTGAPQDSGVDTTPPGDSGGPVDTGTDTAPSDGGSLDTGAVDTGPVDTGVDTGPPPACTGDGDCDDGRACNGVETCVANTCQTGTPIICNDSISCTVDNCVDPFGSCEYSPNDALCAAGQTCVTGSGCAATGTCADSPCRLIAPQCGCGTGQGCYLVGADRACLTAGAVPVGGDCSSAQCVPGAICVNINPSGTAITICRKVCASDSDCSPSGALCLGGIMSTSDKLCTIGCNPTDPSACGANAACNVFSENEGAMRDLTDCAAFGAAGQMGACTENSDCQAGYGCINTGATGTRCLRWCTVGSGAECAGLTGVSGGTAACQDIGLVIGASNYGVCG